MPGCHPPAVVLHKGSTLTAKDIVEYVDQEMEDHNKTLKGGELMIERLPRNANGKVLKGELREMAMEKMT